MCTLHKIQTRKAISRRICFCKYRALSYEEVPAHIQSPIQDERTAHLDMTQRSPYMRATAIKGVREHYDSILRQKAHWAGVRHHLRHLYHVHPWVFCSR